MNYPLISEYIEAIKAAEDNFQELTNLRPVLDNDGQPVMTGGGFAVVFKMKDIETGKFYALKCFIKDQKGRSEAYRQIAEELNDIYSPYLVSFKYLEKELFVDTDQTAETEFPVLLMDWVAGKTLDKYLRENIDDRYEREMLVYNFNQLAQWLMPQPFAHGDIKPDNIMVTFDGSMILIDYDGMYVPAMYGQEAREFGSPDFRQPLRTEYDFNERIDDFSIVSILLSLIAISKSPKLLDEYGAKDRLLFSERDYAEIDSNPVLIKLLTSFDDNTTRLASIFSALCKHNFSFSIPTLKKPNKVGTIFNYRIPALYSLSSSFAKKSDLLSIDELLEALIELNDLMEANNIEYILSGSLGLFIHGMVPLSYIPHDIDIIISSNNKNYYLTNEMILDLFVQYCGGARPDYSYIDASDLFVFYIGINKIEVNAFVNRKEFFDNHDYSIVNIRNHSIKVHHAVSILKAKYQMRRLKDYQFNADIQKVMNGFLDEQDYPAEERRELSEKEIKEWISFFFKSIHLEFSTTINIFPFLFDYNIKRIWLTPEQNDNCFVCTIIWDELEKKWNYSPFEADAIEYCVKDKISKRIKPEESKLLLAHHGDISYIVNLLYEILQEMELIDNFLKNIYKLISIVNLNRKPDI